MHTLLLLAPTTVENFPLPHGWHVVEDVAMSALDHVPASHDTQTPAVEAPSDSEYLPWPHGWHVEDEVAPFCVEYVPCGHLTQVPLVVAPVLVE